MKNLENKNLEFLGISLQIRKELKSKNYKKERIRYLENFYLKFTKKYTKSFEIQK